MLSEKDVLRIQCFIKETLNEHLINTPDAVLVHQEFHNQLIKRMNRMEEKITELVESAISKT